MSYGASIWPDDEHTLPIFSVYWAESAKGSYFIADFYPTADYICDIPYMEKYLEPLKDFFNKGMKYFPSLGSGRNPNWFKALVSSYWLVDSHRLDLIDALAEIVGMNDLDDMPEVLRRAEIAGEKLEQALKGAYNS